MAKQKGVADPWAKKAWKLWLAGCSPIQNKRKGSKERGTAQHMK
jgi:hypothetical protein